MFSLKHHMRFFARCLENNAVLMLASCGKLAGTLYTAENLLLFGVHVDLLDSRSNALAYEAAFAR
jgi:hypothetical protein